MTPFSPARTPSVPASPATVAIDWTRFKPFPSPFVGVTTFDASNSDQVRRYIDWAAVLHTWELPAGLPEVLDDAEWGATARRLLADANDLLTHWLSTGILRTEVVVGVWPASAEGDQLVIRPGSSLPVRIAVPRIPDVAGISYCLADFIRPLDAQPTNVTDYIGGFAVRLHGPVDALIQDFTDSRDEYRALLANDLWLAYRSAVADYLHYRLRRFIWAYCDDDDLSNEELLAGHHQGIRVDSGSIACPDQAAEATLLALLAADSWAPDGSRQEKGDRSPVLSGYFLAHPRSRTLAAFTNEWTRPA